MRKVQGYNDAANRGVVGMEVRLYCANISSVVAREPSVCVCVCVYGHLTKEDVPELSYLH